MKFSRPHSSVMYVIKLLMLKIVQIVLIKKKYYVDHSMQRISEPGSVKVEEAYYMIPSQNTLICFTNRDLKNWVYIFLKYQGTPCAKKFRAEKIYMLFKEIGLNKIKLIKTYSANSISKLTNSQIREIIKEQIDLPINTF